MGTFCTISLDENAAENIDEGFDYLKKIESVLSSYQKEALVSRLNRQKRIPTELMLQNIFQKSKTYYRLTQGYFDITIGSITKNLYHFGENEQIPAVKELQNAPLGIDGITLGKHYITLKENITIDLGGIGKGYGVDRLSDYYLGKGIVNGKIALSGDIRCLDECIVKIQSPFVENETIVSLKSKISNLSISTSGTYRRYIKSKNNHHLINPKSRTQGRAFVSVTVVSKANNTLCDAMATAISVMPIDIALEFVKSQNEFGYLLLPPEGELISGNLEKFVYSKKSISNKQ